LCFRVGDAPWAGGPEAEELKETKNGGFVPTLDEGGGDQDEMVGMGGDGVGEGEPEGGGVEEDVGVGEEEVVGGGLAGGEGHGVGFAKPAGGEFGDVEGAEFLRVLGGDGVDDGAGLVGGAVVDGDYVEVGVVLSQEGVEGGGDVDCLVAGGDDDGDGGRARWGEVVFWFEEIGNSGEAEGGGDDLPEPGEGDQPGKNGEAGLYERAQTLGCFDVTRSGKGSGNSEEDTSLEHRQR